MYYFPDYREIVTDTVKLAEASVPYQQYREIYGVEEGLYRGTIFKELFRPYKKMNPFKY